MAKQTQAIGDFSSLNSIPFDHLIGESLTACIDAQTEASRASLRYLAKVMADEDPMVSFLYQMALPNGQKELRRLVVPLLTIVPFPYMKIETVDIDFRAEVDNLSSSHLDVVIGDDSNYSHAGSSTAQSAQGTIGVRIKATASDTPAGISKLLQLIGNEGVLVRDLPDGEVPQSRFYVPEFVVSEPDDEPEVPSMIPGNGDEVPEPMRPIEPKSDGDDTGDPKLTVPKEINCMVDVVVVNIKHNLDRVLGLPDSISAMPILPEAGNSAGSYHSSSGGSRPNIIAINRSKSVASSRSTSSSYHPTSGSYRPTSSSYHPTSGSYRPTSGSYRPTSGSYRPTSGSYRPTSGSYRPTSGSGKSSSGK